MWRKVLLGTASVLVAGLVVFREELRESLSEVSRSNAAQRQTDFVCRHLAAGTVTRNELCTTLIPKVPAFQTRFQNIREQDEEWYVTHGWKYYPEVICDAQTLVLKFMDRRYVCHDGSAERIDLSNG